MTRRILTILAVLVPAIASAQAPTYAVVWDYAATTVAEVASFTQSVTVDGTAVTALPACAAAANGTDVTCRVSVGALAAGRHTIAVSATHNNVTATTTIAGVDPSVGAPKSPVNFRYQINITVNVP